MFKGIKFNDIEKKEELSGRKRKNSIEVNKIIPDSEGDGVVYKGRIKMHLYYILHSLYQKESNMSKY